MNSLFLCHYNSHKPCFFGDPGTREGSNIEESKAHRRRRFSSASIKIFQYYATHVDAACIRGYGTRGPPPLRLRKLVVRVGKELRLRGREGIGGWLRGEEGNRGTRGGGAGGHANGKLYCRKTNIESAAGSAEGGSSRCLLFILGPTSVAEFLPRYVCMRICLRFYVRVLSLLLSLLTISLFVTGTIDETAGIERILFSPSIFPKGRSADRVVQEGGWSEGGDTNICSSGFAGFEILTNPGWILSVIVDRNCFSSK